MRSASAAVPPFLPNSWALAGREIDERVVLSSLACSLAVSSRLPQGFCQTCLVLLLVGVMFIFTYGLIRISSDRVRAQELR